MTQHESSEYMLIKVTCSCGWDDSDFLSALTLTPLATRSSGRFPLWILVQRFAKQLVKVSHAVPGGDCRCGSHLGRPHCRCPCCTGSLRWCGGWTIAETLHTATHCNTLQHAATRCNTLQHAAIKIRNIFIVAYHCSVLQYCMTYRRWTMK